MTDISIIPTTIPLPYDNIGIAGVLGETKMAFLSGYEYDDTFTNSDVTESIYMFNLIQWTVIGSTFLVLALFLYLHSLSPCNVLRQIMKSPGRAVTKVIDFLMEIMHNVMTQHGWEFESVFQRLIVLTFAFFTFMFITGYNSFVKTDLVSVKIPIVPYSYQDIIDNGSVPVWMPELDDVENYLKRSPVGSIERNFYEAIQSKKETRRWSNVWKIHEAKNPVRNQVDVYINANIYQLRGVRITIATEFMMTAFVGAACSLRIHRKNDLMNDMFPQLENRVGDTYPWMASDSNAASILQVFVQRKDFILRNKKFYRVLNSLISAGIGIKKRKEGFHKDIFLELLKLDPKPLEMSLCHDYSHSLKIRNIDFQAVQLVNTQQLFIYFSTLLAASFSIFVIEVIVSKLVSQKVKHSAKVAPVSQQKFVPRKITRSESIIGERHSRVHWMTHTRSVSI